MALNPKCYTDPRACVYYCQVTRGTRGDTDFRLPGGLHANPPAACAQKKGGGLVLMSTALQNLIKAGIQASSSNAALGQVPPQSSESESCANMARPPAAFGLAGPRPALPRPSKPLPANPPRLPPDGMLLPKLNAIPCLCSDTNPDGSVAPAGLNSGACGGGGGGISALEQTGSESIQPSCKEDFMPRDRRMEAFPRTGRWSIRRERRRC